jgi:hypothetical protein
MPHTIGLTEARSRSHPYGQILLALRAATTEGVQMSHRISLLATPQAGSLNINYQTIAYAPLIYAAISAKCPDDGHYLNS